MVILATVSGPIEVEATMFGPLAVHHSVDGEGWKVTHAATGFAVPFLFVRKQSAIAAAKRICAFDWDGFIPLCAKGKPSEHPDIEKIVYVLNRYGVRQGCSKKVQRESRRVLSEYVGSQTEGR